MTRHAISTITATLIVSSVSCSTPVSTGYLDQQALHQPGQYLDGMWCSDRVSRKPAYSEVRISSVQAIGIRDRRGVSTEDAVSWLRAHLETSRGEDVLLRFSDHGPVASLELAITEMDPGSAVARILVGELGAGHAFVQVEGKLTDATDGTLLCELVQRTRASGAIGFRDVGGDSGPAMVKQILGMIAAAVRDELRAKLEGGPAA
ncbi:MAG: DUF4410 domain-containing protein [Planctomycetota bacterium]|jgi:hypothetical protein